MSKKAFCYILTLLLTFLNIFASVTLASAEELPGDEDAEAVTAQSTVDAEETNPTGTATVPVTETEPATVSKARYPVLTVAAISNYFGRIDAEYNEFTREVTVTYMMKSDKRILTTCWTLTYDSTLLKLDPAKNTKESICPTMKNDASVAFDLEKGTVIYTASDMRMFDFTGDGKAFAKIVFDVPEMTAEDSEITKVDMTVDELWASEPNPTTGESLSDREIVLMANGKIQITDAAKSVKMSRFITITPSTFREPDGASIDQIPTTTLPVTVPTVITTAPTVPKVDKVEKEPENKYLLYTGTWYVALLILVLLLICSTILFVMRKRDIYND